MDTAQTLTSLLVTWAAERTDQPALLFQGQVLTYAQLAARSHSVADFLHGIGVGRHSRVAVLDKNHPSFFEILFGSISVGAVFVPLNFRLAGAELAYLLSDSGAEVLFVGPEYLELVSSLRDKLPSLRVVVPISDAEDGVYAEALRGTAEQRTRRPVPNAGADDIVMQMYTSGTTGQPKGALLSHRNLLAVMRQGLSWCSWRSGDRGMAPMPLFHIGGVGWSLVMMNAGLSVVLMREVDPLAMLRAVQQLKVSQLFVVPVILGAMLGCMQKGQFDVQSLRHVFYGASPINSSLLEQARSCLPCGLVQVYGLTEATGTLSVLTDADHRTGSEERLRSCGRAADGIEIRIVDDKGRAVPPRTMGEIICRSAQTMNAYFGQPEATAQAIRDGWLYTGDAGYLDEEGYLYICDRVKDMIISGGENIYPAEVESVLAAHPSIAEVAVIGIPDARWGESVLACVVCQPGALLDEAALIDWSRTRLAGYKIPRQMTLLPCLPRNASGKVLRRELRAPYWVGHTRQVI